MNVGASVIKAGGNVASRQDADGWERPRWHGHPARACPETSLERFWTEVVFRTLLSDRRPMLMHTTVHAGRSLACPGDPSGLPRQRRRVRASRVDHAGTPSP